MMPPEVTFHSTCAASMTGYCLPTVGAGAERRGAGIVLYCTILKCTVLYYTVLKCTVLYYTEMYCTVLYCTVLYCIMSDKVLGATKKYICYY